jgi:hypothetical protein
MNRIKAERQKQTNGHGKDDSCLYKRSLPNSRLRICTIYRDYCFVCILYSCQKWGGLKPVLGYKISLLSNTGPDSLLSFLGTPGMIYYRLPFIFTVQFGSLPWTTTRDRSLHCHFAQRLAATFDRLCHVQPFFQGEGELDRPLHRVIRVACRNESLTTVQVVFSENGRSLQKVHRFINNHQY